MTAQIDSPTDVPTPIRASKLEKRDDKASIHEEMRESAMSLLREHPTSPMKKAFKIKV